MKKKLIAASASAVALAAMPIVGVFAQEYNTNFVDKLTVTVAPICTWTRSMTTTVTSGENPVGITGGTTATATASKTMTANETQEEFAVSAFNVTCNHDGGYDITGTFTDLGGHASNAANAPAIADKIEYGGANALAAGTWIAKLGDATVGLASGIAGNVSDDHGMDDMTTGTDYQITYGVQTSIDQAAGYYEGTATYVLSQNN